MEFKTLTFAEKTKNMDEKTPCRHVTQNKRYVETYIEAKSRLELLHEFEKWVDTLEYEYNIKIFIRGVIADVPREKAEFNPEDLIEQLHRTLRMAEDCSPTI